MTANHLRFTVRGDTLREVSENAYAVIKDFGLAQPHPVNVTFDVQRDEVTVRGAMPPTVVAAGFIADVTVRFEL